MIAADLAEELLDLAEHYWGIGKRSSDFENPASATGEERSTEPEEQDEPTPAEEKKTAGETEKSEQKESAAEKAEQDEADRPSDRLEPDPMLAAAISVPGNKRKQAFKVLAILWDAERRELGPLSAKEISAHGERIGLIIRQENVRKVIRMRLENQVVVHTRPAGTGTIYEYEIAEKGIAHFRSKYLEGVED
ncbi:MAG: hypothetical protein R6V85_00750 [Polyangia bacterium]